MDLQCSEVVSQVRKLSMRVFVPGLEELVRLIGSDKFDGLSEARIGMIGDYHPIEIGGERFFGRAFSASKEAAAILRLAKGQDLPGRKAILAELRSLLAALKVT